MKLDVLLLQFRFVAKDPIGFDVGKAGNTWRGAFGFSLQRRFCVQRKSGGNCSCSPPCLYSQIFEPAWEGGPSGLSEPPRAFVFRAHDLDGRRFAPGEQFSLSLHLFTRDAEWVDAFRTAMTDAGAAGLGTRGARAELTKVETQEFSVPLVPRDGAPARLTLEFLTPVEIKVEGRIVSSPKFGLLLRRLRDRVSSILSMYQGGTPDFDFKQLGELADRIKTHQAEWRRFDATRRSMRTGQRHSIGGETGKYVLSGDFTQILPWLEAGLWTGVGRQTVWGKGAYRLA